MTGPAPRMLGRRRRLALSALLAASGLASLTHGCAQTPTSVPLRSLERSGKLALICLDPEPSTARPGYSLSDCQAQRAAQREGGSGGIVRLYALVNQTTRGEVAVLDVADGTVVDADPSSPGYNFLPVGAQPVDVTSTPGGSAAFVASAEAGRPAIYALPAGNIRGGAPTIRSWPACVLPAQPGAMTMVVGPSPGSGGTACSSPAVGEVDTPEEAGHPRGDLSSEGGTPGARKLLVTLPTEGELLVIDAQRLLDRPPGSFDLCPIDRRIKLKVDLPESLDLEPTQSVPVCPTPPETRASPYCPVGKPQTVNYGSDFSPFPSSMALSGGQLYVTDEGAPVLHVLDVSDPCSPVENEPLLPSSFDEPWRPVFTSSLAVSPVTHDNKRFLYAVDAGNGSLMTFDISDGGGRREPLIRNRPDYFPYSSRDRIDLGAPVRDVTFLSRDIPYADATGALLPGVLCDPSAGADAVSAAYQTSVDFTTGAGPSQLRGVFGIAALTSGALAVIDIDDYDAACRSFSTSRSPAIGNDFPTWVTGCDTECSGDVAGGKCSGQCQAVTASDANANVNASGEGSCRVFVRNEVRSRFYLANTSQTGPHLPIFQTFPVLTYQGNTLRTDTSDEGKTHPKLLGPTSPGSAGDPSKNGTNKSWTINKGGTNITLSSIPESAENNFVIPDLREPRTSVEQDWAVTYEGVIPGFDGRWGRLKLTGASDEERGIYDASASFCYRGVHDKDQAYRDAARLPGVRADQAQRDAFARDHADYLEITSDILREEDPYWAQVAGQCSYQQCLLSFGTPATPNFEARSWVIEKAYQDRLIVRAKDHPIPDVTDATGQRSLTPECCFPTLVTYRVRGRGTWIATGSVTGFTHNGTIGEGGRCVEGGYDVDGEPCDPTVAVRTSRVYEAPDHAPRPYNDPYTFHNPQLFFVIYAGSSPSVRDMSFAFRMVNGFSGLSIPLARGSVQVAPQSMTFHPALGSQILVADGAQQGVLAVDMNLLAVSRQFF